MKYIILALILFQTPKVITLKEYYCGEAVIFDEKTKYPFSELDYNKSYIPTIEDLKKGEIFLFENYYDYEINVLEHFKLDKSSIKSKYRNAGNVQKKFKKYNRQYVSYINKDNDTILYIGLLNFSNKTKANKYFEGWKQYIYGGAGDFYYENQKFYVINLSKKKFIYKVVGMTN
jgi:glutamate synthase domain-containing protein 1